jgi:hypothetical protein
MKMDDRDPLETVCQLRTWVEKSFLSLETLTLAETNVRYRTVIEIIDRCKKLQIPIPDDISSEKENIEKVRNASNNERIKLTDLAKELMLLAKDIKRQLQKKQSSRTMSGRKAAPKGLQVVFSDGMVICEETAINTFIKTLQHIGLKRVSELQSIMQSGYPLVTTKRSESADFVRETDGYFIQTKTSTEAKAKYIRRIADNLNVDITVNVTEN